MDGKKNLDRVSELLRMGLENRKAERLDKGIKPSALRGCDPAYAVQDREGRVFYVGFRKSFTPEGECVIIFPRS